jgi:hypothetical protein
MFTNSVRAKKHNIHIHIRPDANANTSIRPKTFMECDVLFTTADGFIRNLELAFKRVVRDTYMKQMGGPFKTKNFDMESRYNPKVDSSEANSSKDRCFYNVIINKDRGSSSYGYNFYIYFIPKNEIESCVQKDTHFIVDLKSTQSVVKSTQARRINTTKTVKSKTSDIRVPKNCQLMYKIESEPPYFVATIEEATWLKNKQNINFKEALVTSVYGVLFEVLSEARVEEIDMNDYTKNYVFKSKTDIPKGFKCQPYKVNKTETIYSNMLIDDAVEGVYDMVGKKSGVLVVVIHRSFIGDTREVIYTEDPKVMAAYKDKFMNRQKV